LGSDQKGILVWRWVYCWTRGDRLRREVWLSILVLFVLAMAMSVSAIPIDSCQNITAPGIYELNQSVNSSGTCFTINASDVELNCRGFEVKYNGTGPGIRPGIEAFNLFNLSIRGCIVNGSLSGGTPAMRFTNVTNSSFLNNTALLNQAAGQTQAIIFENSSNGNVFGDNLVSNLGTGTAKFGILINGSENNAFENNNISTNGGNENHAVVLWDGAFNNSFVNNSIIPGGDQGTNYGVFITQDSAYNNLSGNTIVDNGRIASHALVLTFNASSNIIENNLIILNGTDGNAFGILVHNFSINNSFVNNTVKSALNKNHGLSVSNHSDFNRFESNNFILNISFGSNGILIENNSHNITLKGNFIRLAQNKGQALTISDSVDVFVNDTFLNTSEGWIATFGLASFEASNISFSTSSGKIKSLDPFVINGSSNVSQYTLNVSSNLAFLNSTNLSFLNLSAEITLENLIFTEPLLQVDFEDDGSFVDCNTPQCQNLSYNGSTFVFNVSGFTTYKAADLGSVSSCGVLNQSINYTLTQDIESTSSCLFIEADDVVVDCAGFAILFKENANSGINVTGQKNVTIKNCLINTTVDANGGQAILLRQSNDSRVENNTIHVVGNGIHAVRIENSSNNNLVLGNDITALGTPWKASTVMIDFNSTNNDVLNNTLNFTSGGQRASGVLVAHGSSLNVIDNNEMYGDTFLASGVRIENSSFSNNVTENFVNLVTDSNKGFWPIRISLNSSDNFIARNNISSIGGQGNDGIIIQNESNSNILRDNIINVTANDSARLSRGISINSSSTGSQVINNTIALKGTKFNDAVIYVGLNSDSTLLDRNGLTILGSYQGIFLFNNSNNTIVNNNFSKTGVASPGIHLLASHNNTLINSSFNSANIVVDFTESHSNNLKRLSVFSSSSSAGVLLNNSNNNTLANITAVGTVDGIAILQSSGNSFEESSFNGTSSGSALRLFQSHNNTFMSNNFTSNAYATTAVLNQSDSNTFSFNLINLTLDAGPKNNGLSVDASSFNTFTNDSIHAPFDADVSIRLGSSNNLFSTYHHC